MVKLNYGYVQNVKKKREYKVINETHLFMSNRQISEIDDDLTKLNYVTVIYLQNNAIKIIDSLVHMMNLTYLYLEWNAINRISNLNNMSNLRNLYLGYNYISTVEGLKGMPNLKVLHLQRQRLMKKESYKFCSDTVTELSQSLTELNISGNNITSVEDLKTLNELICLDVSYNLISNLTEICTVLETYKKLKILHIEENPLVKNIKYEYEIIASSPVLESLNDKPVSSTTRIFLQTFKKVKRKQEKRKEIEKRVEFSSETRSFVHQLPPEFQEIVSQTKILNQRK